MNVLSLNIRSPTDMTDEYPVGYNVISFSPSARPSFPFVFSIVTHQVFSHAQLLDNFEPLICLLIPIRELLQRFFVRVCSWSFLPALLWLLNERGEKGDRTNNYILMFAALPVDRDEVWQTCFAMPCALYYQFNLMLWLAACLSSDDIRSSSCLHVTFSIGVPGKSMYVAEREKEKKKKKKENEWALDEKQSSGMNRQRE